MKKSTTLTKPKHNGHARWNTNSCLPCFPCWHFWTPLLNLLVCKCSCALCLGLMSGVDFFIVSIHLYYFISWLHITWILVISILLTLTCYINIKICNLITRIFLNCISILYIYKYISILTNNVYFTLNSYKTITTKKKSVWRTIHDWHVIINYKIIFNM